MKLLLLAALSACLGPGSLLWLLGFSALIISGSLGSLLVCEKDYRSINLFLFKFIQNIFIKHLLGARRCDKS